MKTIPWIALTVAIAVAAYLFLSHQKLSAEAGALRAENARLNSDKEAAETAAASFSQAEKDELIRLRKDNEELLRLRNEVRQLRGDKQDLNRQVQTAQQQAQDALSQVQTAQAQAAQAAQALQASTVMTAQQAGQAPVRSLVPAGVTTQAYLDAIRQRGISLDATAQLNACINNLRQMDGAKQQWALESRKLQTDVPSAADLGAYLRNQVPVCPTGGSYSLNSVALSPTCTIPTHALQK